MSLRADIYVSREEDAVRYDNAPGQFVDRAEHKGFTLLELSVLWSIMRGVEWDEASLDQFPIILEKDGGERLIHGLPPQMVSELSRLTPNQITAISPKWAAIEELRWPPEQAHPVVENLARLAQKAIESRGSVYLWNFVTSPSPTNTQKPSFWKKLFRA